MWAFAVYDEQEGSLTLCRDRFGEKFLYYYIDVNGNIFWIRNKIYISNDQKNFFILILTSLKLSNQWVQMS